MDLSTMGAKLDEGMYKDRFAFQADLRLMVANAKLYNIAGSFVHNEAIALETFFEKRKYNWVTSCKKLLTPGNRMVHYQQDTRSSRSSTSSAASTAPGTHQEGSSSSTQARIPRNIRPVRVFKATLTSQTTPKCDYRPSGAKCFSRQARTASRTFTAYDQAQGCLAALSVRTLAALPCTRSKASKAQTQGRRAAANQYYRASTAICR